MVRPHRTVLIAALVGAAVATILGLSTSVYVEKLVDNVIVEGNRKLLNLMGVAMLVILFFRILLTWQQSLLAIITGQKIDTVLIMAIALARALFRENTIILMDEPSSALDIDSEAKLIQALIARR